MKRSTIFHTRVIAGRRKASFSCTHEQKIICSQTLPSICYFYKKYVFLVSSLSRFSGSRLLPLGLQGWEMFAGYKAHFPVRHKGLSTYFFNKILLNVMLQHLWKFVIKALFFFFQYNFIEHAHVQLTFTKDNLQQNENYNLKLKKKKPNTIKTLVVTKWECNQLSKQNFTPY